MFAGLCESCAFLVRFVDFLGFLSFYTKDGFNLQETATQIHRNVEKKCREALYCYCPTENEGWKNGQ